MLHPAPGCRFFAGQVNFPELVCLLGLRAWGMLTAAATASAQVPTVPETMPSDNATSETPALFPTQQIPRPGCASSLSQDLTGFPKNRYRMCLPQNVLISSRVLEHGPSGGAVGHRAQCSEAGHSERRRQAVSAAHEFRCFPLD